MSDKDLEMFKELFQEKIDRIHDSLTAFAEKSSEMDDKILAQATKTNGRVTKLEEETEVIRMLTKNKIIVVALIAMLSGGTAAEIIPLLLGN